MGGPMFKKILIANDGSEGAHKALVVALQLAEAHKGQVHMICVEEVSWRLGGSREELVSEKEIEDRKIAEMVAKARSRQKITA